MKQRPKKMLLLVPLLCLYCVTPTLSGEAPAQEGQTRGEGQVKATLSDAELARELQVLRENHAPHLDMARPSSVLGKLPDGAEAAATHLDLRKVYMGRPLRTLSAAEQATAVREYGEVNYLLNRRTERETFPLGTSGAHLVDFDTESAVEVVSIEPESPAANALAVGDIIFGVYGHLFEKGDDPRMPLGYALADARTAARGGKLVLDLVRDSSVLQVTVELGVEGARSEGWPFDCPLSDAVGARVLRHVLDRQADGGVDFWWNALFLMGMDDHEALELVRRSAYGLARHENLGYSSYNAWRNGYMLVSLCEYYLLTGDAAVLPSAAKLAEVLEQGQMTCGSWSHGCPPGGYGAVNQVGSVCYMALALAREAGIEVDRDVLLRSIRFFGKGVGACMPYGDHTVGAAHYQGAAYNGMNATMAITLHILGADDLAQWTARPIGYAYRNRLSGHAARMFGMAWGAPGAHLATESEFQLYMNNLIWHYELSLKRDGSLQPFTARGDTTSLGMAYALPKQKLRVFGAPKGVFGTRAPAGLAEAAGLFRDKQWKALVAALASADPTDDVGKQYVAGLKAAYERTEQDYKASLALIEESIKDGKRWKAKQQLDALRVFIGEERDAMKALAGKIQDPAPPQPVRAEAVPPPSAAPIANVRLWDVLLAGGSAVADVQHVFGVDGDHPEPALDWTAPDFKPEGWRSVAKGADAIPPYPTLLIRREFAYGQNAVQDAMFEDALEDVLEGSAGGNLLGIGKAEANKPATSYSALCLAAEPGVGGDVYLNGRRILSFTMVNPKDPGPRRFDLGKEALGLLKPGRNVLAARLVGCGVGTARLVQFAVGPAKNKGTVILPPKEPFLPSGSGGYSPPKERFQADCRWFFADRFARDCARFLSHPVFPVIQEAATAIAGRGQEALPLVRELVRDTHPRMRMGGWDVALALHKAGKLDGKAAEELLRLAADGEADARVMQSLAMVLETFKVENPAAHAIALAMARSADPGTRNRAVGLFASGSFMTDPAAAVKVATAMAENWQGNDARMFDTAWRILLNNLDRPETRDAIPAIALVLDNVAHHLRGMFSNGVMTSCMPVLDRYLDAETETTPHLISGLLKCYIKVPKSDWPGWPVAQRAVKKNLYRLSPAVADKVASVVKEQQQWLDTVPAGEIANVGGESERVPMQTVINELRIWGQTLGRLGKGQDHTVLLALASSDNPLERKVAVSAVWAGRGMDPKTEIEVAIAVIDHIDGNDSRHYALAGETLCRHIERNEVRNAVPAIGKALDQAVHDLRDWQSWYANKALLPVLEKYIDKDNELSPGLIAGVAKCAVKASPEWTAGAHQPLAAAYLDVLKRMTPATARTITKTAEELQRTYANGKVKGAELVRLYGRSKELKDPAQLLDNRIAMLSAIVADAVRDAGPGGIKRSDAELIDLLENDGF